MLSKQAYTEKKISLEDLFPNFSQQFLEPFEGILNDDIKHEIHLDFNITGRNHNHKINPILRLARPEDAEEIIEIYKELYDGTYPYKEMEDIQEVRKMIRDPTIQWIIYQDPSYNIAGCITFVFNFVNKRAYIRGFMLREQYQGYIDITKAMIGSMLGMLHKYKDIIYTWYVENRTAHAKSQYSMNVCGIAPIGFYPNKDVFCGKVESDIMQILYDERVLKKYRSREVPKLIPQVKTCFDYSNKRYNLGLFNSENPPIQLNKRKVNRIKKKLEKRVDRNKFGYETITFTLLGSPSSFTFLHTPQVQNFEKTKYKVANLEELYVFVQEFLQCKKDLRIRYCEVFVSAYKPEHQQIFYDAGLMPRGYVPSWNYSNKNGFFEDSILFNMFEEKLSTDIKLIGQGQEFLQTIGLASFSKANECIEILPYETQNKNSPIKLLDTIFFLKSQKKYRNTLLGAMWTYLSLLFVSLSAAMGFGFNITLHTISDLGNSNYTPFPFIFDCACILAGAITIPYNFLIGRSKINSKSKMFKSITSHTGLIFGILGGIGYLFIGIFSLDRSGPDGLYHGVFAILAFSGFVLSIFFFSLRFILEERILPRLFGACGLIFPLIIFLLNVIFTTPLLEWLLLFSILLHVVPLNYLSVVI